MGAVPVFPVGLQPFRELLRHQDPNAGGISLVPVSALEGGAQGGGVVGEKGCLQYILRVLQLQVVVIQETPGLALVVDVLIGQDAGVELGRQLVRERLADVLAQDVVQKATPVVVSMVGQDGFQGEGQLTALQQFHFGWCLRSGGYAFCVKLFWRQDDGGVVPQSESLP